MPGFSLFAFLSSFCLLSFPAFSRFLFVCVRFGRAAWQERKQACHSGSWFQGTLTCSFFFSLPFFLAFSPPLFSCLFSFFVCPRSRCSAPRGRKQATADHSSSGYRAAGFGDWLIMFMAYWELWQGWKVGREQRTRLDPRSKHKFHGDRFWDGGRVKALHFKPGFV